MLAKRRLLAILLILFLTAALVFVLIVKIDQLAQTIHLTTLFHYKSLLSLFLLLFIIFLLFLLTLLCTVLLGPKRPEINSNSPIFVNLIQLSLGNLMDPGNGDGGFIGEVDPDPPDYSDVVQEAVEADVEEMPPAYEVAIIEKNFRSSLQPPLKP